MQCNATHRNTTQYNATQCIANAMHNKRMALRANTQAFRCAAMHDDAPRPLWDTHHAHTHTATHCTAGQHMLEETTAGHCCEVKWMSYHGDDGAA